MLYLHLLCFFLYLASGVLLYIAYGQYMIPDESTISPERVVSIQTACTIVDFFAEFTVVLIFYERRRETPACHNIRRTINETEGHQDGPRVSETPYDLHSDSEATSSYASIIRVTSATDFIVGKFLHRGTEVSSLQS